MGKRSRYGSVLLFSVLALTLSGQLALATDAHFSIQPSGSVLEITATLQDLPSGELYLLFATAGAGKKGLDRRIRQVEVVDSEGSKLTVNATAPGVYKVSNIGFTNLKVKYTLDPRFAGWDYHFPTITSSQITVPVQYTLFELRLGEPDGMPLLDRVTFGFSGLPSNWKVLTTSQPLGGGKYQVDNIDAIFSAGRYLERQVSLGSTTFRLAINNALGYSVAVLDQVGKVIEQQYRLFGGYIPKQALVVINPLPKYARTLAYGGQTKPANVLFYTQPMRAKLQAENLGLVSNLAHETFHLWVGQSFRLYEGVYWFTEGFAVYNQYRLLKQMNLISREELMRFLAGEFTSAASAQKRAPVSLQKAGASLFSSVDLRTLAYSKGALVAYMLDEELSSTDISGKGFDQFLNELYMQYGVQQVPMGNLELIQALGNATGSDLFAQRWVLEPTAIEPADVPMLSHNLPAAWMAALPEKVLEVLNPPMPIKILIVFFAVVIGAGYGVRSVR